MIQLRNYTVTCCELTLINTMIYQMQIEKNKAPNINVKCYFLNHMIIMRDLKMLNWLIKKNRLI